MTNRATTTADVPCQAQPAQVNSVRSSGTYPSMKISLKSVLLFIAAMSVMLLLVYSTMEVSRINGEYHAAAQELQKLKAEEGILIRKAEASLSLSEVEAYAIGELGMVKPSREQFVYIGSPAYDHAEVVRTENFLGKAKQVFSSVGVRVVEFLD